MRASERERPQSSRRPGSRIPTFKTVEEEAALGDAHSLEEFAGELEDVTDVQFVKVKPKKGITVRLEEDTLASLRQRAHDIGVGPATLVRMWIVEHLRGNDRHGDQ